MKQWNGTRGAAAGCGRAGGGSGAREALRVGGAILVALGATACSPELDHGTWEATLAGSSTRMDGSEADWTGTVTLDLAYEKSRGTLAYDVTVCAGLTEFMSTTPCFPTFTVLDTTDGLVGSGSEAWQTTSGDVALCQGTESISLTGEAVRATDAEVELLYHLNLDSASAAGCAGDLASTTARIVAAGAMAHVGP